MTRLEIFLRLVHFCGWSDFDGVSRPIDGQKLSNMMSLMSPLCRGGREETIGGLIMPMEGVEERSMIGFMSYIVFGFICWTSPLLQSES